MRPRDQACDRGDQHQHRTDDDRARAVALADLQHRRRDLDLLVQMLPGRPDEHDQEGDDQAHAERIEPCARLRAHVLHEGRQLHVRAAAQRDARAEHREPQEEDAGELVGPRDRRMQGVAREGAAAEDEDLGQHEQRGGTSVPGEQRSQSDAAGASSAIVRSCIVARRLRCARGVQASGPEYFSSLAQTSSPYLPFHSV